MSKNPHSLKIDFCTPEAQDGSVKYRFRTHDCLFIEALFFRYKKEKELKILCLSTQIGCDMKCCFCHSGTIKKVRNVSQEEIVDQALLILEDRKEQPDVITLAGMGEPLANYDASIGALHQFRSMFENIHLSLSTVGLKEGLRRMIREKCSFGLYLSLHSSDEEVRKRIMPSSKQCSLRELFSLLQEYAALNTPGTVRISYLLLDGLTNTKEQLHKLVDLIKNRNFQVQFRILNPFEGVPVKGCSIQEAEAWVKALQQENISADIRPSKGQEVQGACGQICCGTQPHRIIPITSIHEAMADLESADQKTLIILDVDSTLIRPDSILLHPHVVRKHKEELKKVYSILTPNEKHVFNHCLIACPSVLVESAIVSVLQCLQKKKIPMIAMTNAKPGIFDDSGRRFHEVRLQQLQTVGIDCPLHPFPDHVFETGIPTYGDFPRLINGILYCCGLHNTKGDMLKAFLQECSPKGFPRVILLDDKRKHLESVASTLKESFPGIEFIGYHYKASDAIMTECEIQKEEFSAFLHSLMEKVQNLDWVK